MDDLPTSHFNEFSFGHNEWSLDELFANEMQLPGGDSAEAAAGVGAPLSPDASALASHDSDPDIVNDSDIVNDPDIVNDDSTYCTTTITTMSEDEMRQRDELFNGCGASVARFCHTVVEDAGHFVWDRLDASVSQVKAYVSKTARVGVRAAFDARMAGDTLARGCVLVQSNGKPGAWIIASPDADFLPTQAVAGIANGRPTCREGWHENSCRQRNARSFLNVQLGLRAWFSVDDRHCLFVGIHETSRRTKKLRTQRDEPQATTEQSWPAFNPCFGDKPEQ